MAIFATYLELQKAIADELGNRIDLLEPLSDSGLTLSPIQNAIQTAIAKWEREPFYFTEVYNTGFFTTAAGQEFYTSALAPVIATTVNIERLHIAITGGRYALVPRKWTFLEDISFGSTTSEPTDYAYFADQIRLFPIPNGIYIVTMTGTQRLAILDSDNDTNRWTEDGYDLIRSEAKLILASEILHDAEMAARMETAIYGNPQSGRRGYLEALQMETARRKGLALPRANPNSPVKARQV